MRQSGLGTTPASWHTYVNGIETKWPSTPNSSLGRHVFGLAGLVYDLITLAWDDYNDGHQQGHIVYAAAALIFGGADIPKPKVSRKTRT